ncbi:hypothetical protein ACFOVU_09665 [Nocardiopsis sediminis]|uniref:Uncharacterized protein n=1 Tax=Nocardiopsis sediminis TaxID=1778267 RepID=A0ABV8FNB3_9ACTN
MHTVDSLARRVVDRCAPQESPHYPAIRDDYYGRGGRPPVPRDNPLGFGAVTIGFVTGVVLSVVGDLVSGAIADAVRPWWRRAGRWLLERIGLRERLAPAALDGVVPIVRRAQAASVTAAITERAVRLGMSPEQAADLAAAIIDELAETRGNGSPEPSPGPPDPQGGA